MDALSEAGESPFFLFVNFLDAHWPYEAPYRQRRLHGSSVPALPKLWTTAAFREVFEDRRDLAPPERQELIDLYDSELSYLDSQLGRLLSALTRHPRWSEMIVLITSDHGEALGEHRLLLLNLFQEVLNSTTLAGIRARP